jgi:hypothetical protein
MSSRISTAEPRRRTHVSAAGEAVRMPMEPPRVSVTAMSPRIAKTAEGAAGRSAAEAVMSPRTDEIRKKDQTISVRDCRSCSLTVAVDAEELRAALRRVPKCDPLLLCRPFQEAKSS